MVSVNESIKITRTGDNEYKVTASVSQVHHLESNLLTTFLATVILTDGRSTNIGHKIKPERKGQKPI
jgi:hypothetical protein